MSEFSVKNIFCHCSYQFMKNQITSVLLNISWEKPTVPGSVADSYGNNHNKFLAPGEQTLHTVPELTTLTSCCKNHAPFPIAFFANSEHFSTCFLALPIPMTWILHARFLKCHHTNTQEKGRRTHNVAFRSTQSKTKHRRQRAASSYFCCAFLLQPHPWILPEPPCRTNWSVFITSLSSVSEGWKLLADLSFPPYLKVDLASVPAAAVLLGWGWVVSTANGQG